MAVPPGFVITAAAYLWALEQAGVRDRLRDQSAAASGDDTSLPAGEMRALVRRVPVPDELREAILAAYRGMGDRACRWPSARRPRPRTARTRPSRG